MAAGDQLARGSLKAAEWYLGLAERRSASVPEGRRGQVQVLLGVVRLLLARQQGNLPAVAEHAEQLQALAEAPETAQRGLGDELRALALVSLGITEFWTARFEEAQRHLEQGTALARRIGRPFLEFTGLAYRAMAFTAQSPYARRAERSRQAIDLAEQHGWTDDPAAGYAYVVLASVLAWQGRPEEAEPLVQRAERAVRAEAEPATGLVVCYVRGLLELARGRVRSALAAFRVAERLAGDLAAPDVLVLPSTQAWLLHALVRLGETEQAEQVLAGLDEDDRDRGEIRTAVAALRLARADPHGATVALARVLDGTAPVGWPTWLMHAFLLEGIARDALGDQAATTSALERALDLAEPDGALLAFLIHPAPGLLERHARQGTTHAALLARILDLLAGNRDAPPPARPRPPLEPLSNSELRVLRYLPTYLSAAEIAGELSVSTSTVKTHLRNLYGKLGVHSRSEAVESARALDLLAPPAHPRRAPNPPHRARRSHPPGHEPWS